MSQQSTIDDVRAALRDVAASQRGGRASSPVPAAQVPVEPEAEASTEPNTLQHGLLAPDKREAFIYAGNSIFTVQSPTGTRFTYRVRRADDDPRFPGVSYFVGVLSGPQNTDDYTYIGLIKAGAFRTTRNSRLPIDAPSVRAIGWLVPRIHDPRVQVWHEGRCGRCGRLLTVPTSIEAGIGPECAEKLGGGQ